MKNLKLVFLLTVILFTFNSCSKDNSDDTTVDDKTETSKDIRGDKINSFKVDYKIEGGVTEGTVTTLVKDKSFKTTVTFNVMGQKLESVTLGGADTVYMMMDMGVMKENIKMSTNEFKGETGDDPMQIDFSNIEEILSNYNKLGTETILGKLCDIYDLGDGTIMAVYQGKIPFKIQNKDLMLVATDYELNPVLNDDEFIAPTDIEFKDVSGLRGMN